MIACRLVSWLTDQAERRAANPIADSPYDPPYSTLTCGRIEGGTALNIIARDCWFLWDMRAVPGDDPVPSGPRSRPICDTLRPAMRAISPEAGIITEVLANAPASAWSRTPTPNGWREA